MDTSYAMAQAESHYAQQQAQAQRQQQQQQQQHWPPHLLTPTAHPHAAQASFSSPPPSEHTQHYPSYYPHPSAPPDRSGAPQPPGSEHMTRASSTLSLNLSALSVTSPTNPSPIGASSAPPSALSPATPISPSGNPFGPHGHAAQQQQPQPPQQQQHMQQAAYAYDPHQSTSNQAAVQQQQQTAQQPVVPPPPSQQQQQPPSGSPIHYDDLAGSAQTSSSPYDTRRTPGPSRSSSVTSSSSQLPRKRSFTSNPLTPGPGTATPVLEESMYDEARDEAMELASVNGAYDDMDMRTPYGGASGNSPVDGSGSTSGAEDALGGAPGAGSGGPHVGLAGLSMGLGTALGAGATAPGGPGAGTGTAGNMNVLGKPMATNNFVTKLYQMINDPKSSHFIAWTELGTSFVVSNVGEFSRSILGAHFKHNNFSSFVRQLNMYGFHKINRTPRAQRTSTDAQTWEFSHHKFLRGRPDLLDEIKRKALEPEPMKHRVELPGEVAAQLTVMRDENRRMWEQLSAEKKRSEKLIGVVGRLWEVVNSRFPGSMPPFPTDLLDNDSPNIYITSPTSSTPASRFPPPLSMNLHTMHSLGSANSSPTTTDFPSQPHMQQQHPPLSRHNSFQHVSYSSRDGTSSTPLPAESPGSVNMDLFDDGVGCEPSGRISTKRQRMSTDDVGGALGALNGSSPGGDGLLPMSSLSSPGTATGPGIGALAQQNKKSSRARSDSAPLGYGFGGLTTASWQGTGIGGGGAGGVVSGRPRSGSGMTGRGVPNIGTMTRANGTPLLPLSSVLPSAPNR